MEVVIVYHSLKDKASYDVGNWGCLNGTLKVNERIFADLEKTNYIANCKDDAFFFFFKTDYYFFHE